MKTIDTLIPDIHAVFKKEHVVDEANIKYLTDTIADVVRTRLSTDQTQQKHELRLSKLGTKDRKLWFELHSEKSDKENEKDPSLIMKFLYGDIIEAIVLFLAKEAGHTVEGEQGEIDIDGVKGHRDCIIDGITTDVKSTSRFAFSKFSMGTLFKDDPFGYIGQISGYAYADRSPYGAFLAMCKETGELALLKVDTVDMINPPSRIAKLRDMLSKDTPPEQKCYEPEPQGTKGNMVLSRNCGFCAFKDLCWTDANNGVGLRKFKYSDGIKFFTTVLEEPRVNEVVE